MTSPRCHSSVEQRGDVATLAGPPPTVPTVGDAVLEVAGSERATAAQLPSTYRRNPALARSHSATSRRDFREPRGPFVGYRRIDSRCIHRSLVGTMWTQYSNRARSRQSAARAGRSGSHGRAARTARGARCARRPRSGRAAPRPARAPPRRSTPGGGPTGAGPARAGAAPACDRARDRAAGHRRAV